MMNRNLCVSEEPGLYDPAKSCGFNWSDTVVAGKESGHRMSRVPYSDQRFGRNQWMYPQPSQT